ncbi:glycoside hydrolase family 31 protein [Mucilaginibacter sp. cycad4]|uniref:glycoside hydrolase family 31 protein n=1 Tax=Mucilaginibacter sp. cycad4 TaxID=3342096 RepID=UPI002AAC0600|nr:glycoside hydrolase family 31 protein [Mucilaginibacter gossypii]WPU97859.1 glycoside hydrolase family 31 protein [Mucilaginibacter gossypii]
MLTQKQILKSAFSKISTIVLLVVISISVKASVISYKKNANGLIFKLDKGLMYIAVCKADLIEVKYTIFGAFETKPSLVVNNSWKTPTPYQIAENKNEVTITTSKLKVKVNKATNAITYTDLKGNIITAEDADNKTITPATIAGISTYNVSTQFISPKTEGLFGLGCHPLDSLSINYKGRNQELLIKYLTGAIPVLLSTKGYGLLWDNYSASNFYGAEADNTKFKYVSESGKQVDYFFFYGPSFDHIIDLYRTATGRAPMFGKWAFGLFQSQDRYMSEEEIIGVKDNYRNNHIPVDVIVQDWYYWDPLPIGSHVMKPERYPHPKQMVDELHKANIHAMISIWPVFGKGTPNYDALQKMGGLTDITWDNVVTHTFDTYYDAHNPKARELYWDQARDSLIKRYDWDAWWIDQCEPDNGALQDARRQSNFSIGKGIDYFNTYSLQHTKGVYEGWRRDIPGKRAFFLVRQSFAGEQRNASTLWSGDIECTFKDFKNQVPQGINACASGLPYWTSDIGGYHFHWKAADWSQPDKRELFTRWFQFGAFSPIFRIHGKGERALFSKNWDDNTKAILLNFDKLRYRLLPYIYSLAGRVTTDNYTIMRSLAFDFRNDAKVYSIPDQYMFGPAFMVNPVTEQLYTSADADKKAKARQVYLPAASKWYDFWTGELLDGGQTISAAAPIEILPLYVKAGSIIPMGPHMEYATEKPADNIELRIYPGADGSFKFYEDENDNYNYEKGQYATFTFAWDNNRKELRISETKGNFPGMIKHRIFNVVLVGGKHGSGPSEVVKADKRVVYNGSALVVKL